MAFTVGKIDGDRLVALNVQYCNAGALTEITINIVDELLSETEHPNIESSDDAATTDERIGCRC